MLAVQVRDALLARASDFGIVLEDVAITHLSFGTEVRPDSMRCVAGLGRCHAVHPLAGNKRACRLLVWPFLGAHSC
jgi:hypothetical protein